MIEYFYHFTFHKNISTCILISDGTTLEQFKGALDKYNFTPKERSVIIASTYFDYQPKVILANDMLFVDGSLRNKGCDIICKRKIFFRCAEEEFLDQADIVLQDYDLYEPLPNSVDYKKRILLGKMKEIDECKEDIAMFYATGNTRLLSYDDLVELTNKYKHDKYIVLSNVHIDTPENVEWMEVPVPDIFTKFNTYIYTSMTNLSKFDCSSRFIVECKHYNKDVVFDTNRIDKGLAVRKNDLDNDVDLELKETDEITSII